MKCRIFNLLLLNKTEDDVSNKKVLYSRHCLLSDNDHYGLADFSNLGVKYYFVLLNIVN